MAPCRGYPTSGPGERAGERGAAVESLAAESGVTCERRPRLCNMMGRRGEGWNVWGTRQGSVAVAAPEALGRELAHWENPEGLRDCGAADRFMKDWTGIPGAGAGRTG